MSPLPASIVSVLKPFACLFSRPTWVQGMYRDAVRSSHRKMVTCLGLESCQYRKARIQRNHIGCAFLVRVCLKRLAAKTGCTVYQLKHGLLDDYLIQQLKRPALKMNFV